jgi:hypothetical protein
MNELTSFLISWLDALHFDLVLLVASYLCLEDRICSFVNYGVRIDLISDKFCPHHYFQDVCYIECQMENQNVSLRLSFS